ncbi:MAG: hypothetical protein ACFFDT_08295 [Candidatus Hodarchaeota archaeon]
MKNRLILTWVVLLLALTPISISFGTNPGSSWGTMHVKGLILEWTITLLEDENGTNSWTWNQMDSLVLSQGDKITFEWIDIDTGKIISITAMEGTSGINYSTYANASIKVGGTPLTLQQSAAMMWLVLPVYYHFANEIRAGFSLIQGHFTRTYPLPGGINWDIDTLAYTTSLNQIGLDASAYDEVKGYIISTDNPRYANGTTNPYYSAYPIVNTNIYCFDLVYSAAQGVLTKLSYPTTIPQNVVDKLDVGIAPWPAHANNATTLTENLASLEITLDTSLPLNQLKNQQSPESNKSGSMEDAIPGWSFILLITSIVIWIKFRKKSFEK